MIALSGAILPNRAWATVNAGNRAGFLRVICFAKALYVSVRAFFRGLVATAAGSIAGSSFLLRPPATGKSNER
jgi:hypothetical protein